MKLYKIKKSSIDNKGRGLYASRDIKEGTKIIDYIGKICNILKVPLTVLGGASSLSDFKLLYNKFGIIGAAAGSVFTLKGKYNAVLINYPSNKEKKAFKYLERGI